MGTYGWGRFSDVTLIVLGLAELVVFIVEVKKHGWSGKAWLEAFVVLVLLVLGGGDWHVRTLEKADADERDQQLAPFLAAAKSRFPDLDAHKGLERLSSQLDEVRERTTKIEHQITPRTITKQQANAITAKLKGSPQAITVESPLGDHEAEAYGDQLADALRAAGWTVELRSAQGTALPDGLYVVVHDPASPPPLATQLVDAIQAAGIAISGAHIDSVKDGTVKLWVSHRPKD